MISDLRSALVAADADELAVQFLRSVFSALPPEARLENRGGLGGLLAEPVTARGIREDFDGVSAASDIAAALDHGDLLHAVAVSPRVALSLYDAHLEWALGVGDLEREQSRDAAVRLHGIGLLAQRLFDGSTPERAGELLSYEAGRALVVWFIAVELVLAMSTEDEPVTSQHLRDLIEQHGESVIQDLSHLASRADREGGQDIIKAMLGVIGPVVPVIVAAVPAVAGAVRQSLPDLADGGQDALIAEAEHTGVYMLLTARLVAEIEAERLDEVLPEPDPPVVQARPEIEAARARLEAAQARWDPALESDAVAAVAAVQAQLDALRVKEQAHSKALRAAKRKLTRTVDRRARLAEAPPAGQAEAEAAVERAVDGLKAADKAVKKALRQVSTADEAVVAAKAALRRRDQTLEQKRGALATAEAAAAGLQERVSDLQAQDEASVAGLKVAEQAAAAALAQARVDMEQRLHEGQARCVEIDDAVPQARERIAQIVAQLSGNKGAMSDLSKNREGLADALVKAREAQPDQQQARKAKGEIRAQAEVQRDRSADALKGAAQVLKQANSALNKADKVAGRAREKLVEVDETLSQRRAALQDAAARVEQINARIEQGRLALVANDEAQAAIATAMAAAQADACAAVQRALQGARGRQDELLAREQGLSGAMQSIAQREANLDQSFKALTTRKEELQADMSQAQAHRTARLKMIEDHLKQVQAKGQSLHSGESTIGDLIKNSRKAGAAHAGAAARVVGARDALKSAQRRVSSAVMTRDQAQVEHDQVELKVSSLRAELAGLSEKLAADSSPPQDSSGGDVEALVAEIRPKPTTLRQRRLAERAQAKETQTPEPDDAATAMFTPESLRARLQREQQIEDAAAATVMFARNTKAPDTQLNAPPDDDDATVIFTVQELQARAQAEEDEADPDDATVIFQRRDKDD